MKTNSNPPLVLASGSPRRQELLKQAGFDFQVLVKDFDESFSEKITATEVAEYLALKKNSGYRELLVKEAIIITADTTVVLHGEVLNKPEDEVHAFKMLNKLSGATHQVICGVCISDARHKVSFSDTTQVTFNTMTEQEINHYIRHYQPMDKAGAYGIQEWIGLTCIKSIEGSYYNVMGLPVHKVYKVLQKEFGYKFF